ncbi:unnamed protein product, partial [Iphiclides podalirius]
MNGSTSTCGESYLCSTPVRLAAALAGCPETRSSVVCELSLVSPRAPALSVVAWWWFCFRLILSPRSLETPVRRLEPVVACDSAERLLHEHSWHESRVRARFGAMVA